MSEQNNAPYKVVYLVTSFGLVAFTFLLVCCTIIFGFSPGSRLIEPFALYLVVVINIRELPLTVGTCILDSTFFNGLFWLGLVLPSAMLWFWNWMVSEKLEQGDRVIDAEYLSGYSGGVLGFKLKATNENPDIVATAKEDSKVFTSHA
ncbi:hypothetical protein B0H16DRAFT_1464637 [Mycena metata]|uniref:Uncharacterized protein n=1 Tax=Mycena metata TaxID=1033252 RepID=A0AAD7N148_9AGAR|nr:hypothetical protein B0H16DRAFT_1464637 [Mycena metata]